MMRTFSVGDLVMFNDVPCLVIHDRDPGKDVMPHVSDNTWSDPQSVYVNNDRLSRCHRGDPNYILLSSDVSVFRVFHDIGHERFELIGTSDA